VVLQMLRKLQDDVATILENQVRLEKQMEGILASQAKTTSVTTTTGEKTGGEKKPKVKATEKEEKEEKEKNEGGGEVEGDGIPKLDTRPKMTAEPPQDEAIALSLEAHNKWRAAVGSPPLEWSEELAKSAKQVAASCAKKGKLAHSSFDGENLSAQLKNYDPYSHVSDWGSEIKDMDLSAPRTFPDCAKSGKDYTDIGHYTQLVWRETQKVGGGYAVDKKGMVFYCCHYSPGGNKKGASVF